MVFRDFIFSSLFIAALFFVGCGGSQEATQQDLTLEEEPMMEEPMVDTSWVVTDTMAVSEPSITPEQAMQQELDELKTENIQLKEQLSTTAQANQDLAAKVAELESMKSQPKQKYSGGGEEGYESALALAKAKQYDDAIEEFKVLLSGGIDASYADNCNYWLGECYFAKRNFKTAMSYFKKVSTYKVSEKKDDAQLMIAQCYERMGNTAQAKAEYENFLDMFPNSEYVARVQRQLQNLQ